MAKYKVTLYVKTKHPKWILNTVNDNLGDDDIILGSDIKEWESPYLIPGNCTVGEVQQLNKPLGLFYGKD